MGVDVDVDGVKGMQENGLAGWLDWLHSDLFMRILDPIKWAPGYLHIAERYQPIFQNVYQTTHGTKRTQDEKSREKEREREGKMECGQERERERILDHRVGHK